MYLKKYVAIYVVNLINIILKINELELIYELNSN